MTSTSSRSRTPSRATTPAPAADTAPTRLPIPAAMRPPPSLSNLRVQSHNSIATVVPPSPARDATLDSSASSVVDVDLEESILVQVADTDDDATNQDADDVNVMGVNNAPASDEQSKKTLREHLRKTLSYTQTAGEASSFVPRKRSKKPQMNELTADQTSRFPPRDYFVLTEAGKPVFTSRPGEDALDNLTAPIGIMQALISVFLDDRDKIRCIKSGRNRITFLLRPPLYYVCSSSWGEPESVVSIRFEDTRPGTLIVCGKEVTGEQLRRIFEKRSNFDLRRLLNGSETLLIALLRRMEFDLAMSTSSLQCIRFDPSIRKRVAENLVPSSKSKDILYVMLIARGRVMTLIRPKRHSIHPADIHILLNTIHSPSIMDSPAASSYIPVCLPKFNPKGFVNAYISFLRREDDHLDQPKLPPKTAELGDRNSSVSSTRSTKTRQSIDEIMEEDTGIALVCVSGGADFETVRSWCDTVSQKLDKDGLLSTIALNIRSGQINYSISELGIPGLRHFMYKSRPLVQLTMPLFEDPYDDIHERRRLVTLYQILHDAIHAKSGQEEPLKLQYIRTEKESVMGWITQPFELYISISPRLPKSAVVGAANAVTRWVKKEESRLFLRDAPVF